jgi:hypothetical protein
MGRVDSTPPPSLLPAGQGASAKPSARGSSGFGQSDFAPSSFASPRLIAAEELFDIQEQADFFMSLDQPDQAIEVLKNHITDNVETSALAYMDLFDIYHRTGRQKEYADLREEFNRVFNAQVPEFSLFGAHSDGLEGFPAVLKNIQDVWLTHQAMDVIEESIFRQPEEGHQVLDMLAYRELMLLYALAKELARPTTGFSMLPSGTQSPMIAPLFAAAEKSSGDSVAPDLDLGDSLAFSGPPADMLSFDDPTVTIPENMIAKPSDTLDFDLSDTGALEAKKPLKVIKKA